MAEESDSTQKSKHLDLFNSKCQKIQDKVDNYRRSIESASSPDFLWDLGSREIGIWNEIKGLYSLAVNNTYAEGIMKLRQSLSRAANLRGARILASEGDPQEQSHPVIKAK